MWTVYTALQSTVHTFLFICISAQAKLKVIIEERSQEDASLSVHDRNSLHPGTFHFCSSIFTPWSLSPFINETKFRLLDYNIHQTPFFYFVSQIEFRYFKKELPNYDWLPVDVPSGVQQQPTFAAFGCCKWPGWGDLEKTRLGWCERLASADFCSRSAWKFSELLNIVLCKNLPI